MEGYCAVYMRTAPANPLDTATEQEQRECCAKFAQEHGCEVVSVYPAQGPDRLYREPKRGCDALLDPYLDDVAATLIAEQEQRDRDDADALSRWYGEGGR